LRPEFKEKNKLIATRAKYKNMGKNSLHLLAGINLSEN
jgi:hypothetical protein